MLMLYETVPKVAIQKIRTKIIEENKDRPKETYENG